MKATSPNYNWPSGSIMNIEKHFVYMQCDQKASTFHANTHLLIIPIKSVNSVPLQDSVRPSLSHDTLQLSSDHGDGQIVTMLWGRCCSPTNTSTSSQRHATISCIEAYSLLLMRPHQNPC